MSFQPFANVFDDYYTPLAEPLRDDDGDIVSFMARRPRPSAQSVSDGTDSDFETHEPS